METRAGSPPPRPAPRGPARAGSQARPHAERAHNFSLLARKHAPRVPAAGGGRGVEGRPPRHARSPPRARTGEGGWLLLAGGGGGTWGRLSPGAHLRSGSRAVLRSVSGTNGSFRGRKRAHVQRGARGQPASRLVQEPLAHGVRCFCEPAAFYSRRPGFRGRGVRVGGIPDGPELLLLGAGAMRARGGAATGLRGTEVRQEEQNLRGKRREAWLSLRRASWPPGLPAGTAPAAHPPPPRDALPLPLPVL